jgi:hypothetical protein
MEGVPGESEHTDRQVVGRVECKVQRVSRNNTPNTLNLLPTLYWILIILALIGTFVPFGPHSARINGGCAMVLFILLGLRVFPISLQ